MLIQGNNLWIPKEGPPASISSTRTSRATWASSSAAGASARSSATSTTTAGSTSTSPTATSRSTAIASYWYDFSKIAGGNSAIIGDAANWPAMNGRSLSGYQQKKRLAQRRRRQVRRGRPGRRRHRHLRRPRRRPGRSLEPRRARCRRRQPARPAADLQEHRRRRKCTGSSSSSKAPRATAARSARRSRCSGTASSRCRRFPAEAVLPRRTSAACISGWAKPQYREGVIRWPSGTTQTLETARARQAHHNLRSPQ